LNSSFIKFQTQTTRKLITDLALRVVAYVRRACSVTFV